LNKGKIVILSAPSGAGKTSLGRALMEKLPNVAWSVSHTTRPPRPGEKDGRDYHFVSREEFQHLLDEGDFLEYAEVYGNWYGTSRRALQRQLEDGKIVLLDIDWQGARQIRQAFPDAVSVYIMPPSIQELENRLRKRGQDPEQVIKKRLAAAEADMSHAGEYDKIIINDDFDTALAELVDFIKNQSRFSHDLST